MRRNKVRKGIKACWSDRIFDLVCNLILGFLVLIMLYPVYFVLVASFTEPEYVNSGAVLLYPVKFTLAGYERVFSDRTVWTGYFNTIIYVAGTALLGLAVTMMAGYALSRKDLMGKSIIMKIMVFTMYFSGGMIPTFLVVKQLGLLDSRFLIILLGSISVYNSIVVRSFLMSNIPDELYDAAIIDGCGHGNFFIRVVIPLSKAVMAVIAMYLVVGQWNSYFNAMLYLTDEGKYPLQMYLREQLLIASSLTNPDKLVSMDPEQVIYLRQMAQVLKYSLIVVATAPVMCIYPFLQKYFMKGVMVGSIKG